VLHNGSVVTVAGNNVTLVSDATHPRWTWIGISSVGVATIISGTPAAAPTVPELGDYVCSQLVLVQANLTIATNATAKLDKRVIYTPTKTVLTTTGDSLYASGANTEARLAIGTTNQALTVVAGVPAWRASATSVLTTTADVLYASAANVLARLGIGSTGQTLTVSGGLPTWQASPTSVLTTTGDVLYASSANTLARRGIGSTGQVITVAGGVPTWATPSASEWVKVSAGLVSGSSASFTSLSGYKRYRVQVLTQMTATQSTWSLTINGLASYNSVRSSVQNNTQTNAIETGIAASVIGVANGGAGGTSTTVYQLVLSCDESVSRPIGFAWQWSASGGTGQYQAQSWGGGSTGQNQSSITAFVVTYGAATVGGTYLLEGSNS